MAVANLVAWPVVWFVMRHWLQNFAYRIGLGWPREIAATEFLRLITRDPPTALSFFFSEVFISRGWWMFGMIGTLVLLIAIFTVGAQAIRAALANPVKALRYE
ncbi:MAG: hypothetical protein ACREOI_15750 [bacterium]